MGCQSTQLGMLLILVCLSVSYGAPVNPQPNIPDVKEGADPMDVSAFVYYYIIIIIIYYKLSWNCMIIIVSSWLVVSVYDKWSEQHNRAI